jgi:hypothetical protein
MLKHVLILIAFLLTGIGLFAQNSLIVWESTYGGTGNSDRCFSISNVSDGGNIMTGFHNSTDGSVSNPRGGQDMWVVRTDLFGNIIWEKALGGTSGEAGYRAIETMDGGFIAVGFSSWPNGDVTFNNGEIDYWVVKLDQLGNIEWEKSYGGSEDDIAFDVIQLADSSYIIAGQSMSDDGMVSGHHGATNRIDIWIIRIDPTGNIIWENSYGGTENEAYTSAYFNTVMLDSHKDGTFAVGTTTYSNDGDVTVSGCGGKYWLVELDTSGNILFEDTYGGCYPELAHGMKATSDGGYIMNGGSRSNEEDVSGHHGSTNEFDAWVVKLDSLGNIQWQNSLGSNGYEDGMGITEVNNGGYVGLARSFAAGGDCSGNYGNSDFWLFYLDPSGNLLWEDNFGGSGHEEPMDIVQALDGSLVVAGHTGSNDHDVSFLRAGFDWWAFKIHNVTEIQEHEDLWLSANLYPNPAVDQIQLDIRLKKQEKLELCCYDVLGKVMFKESLPKHRTIEKSLDLTTLRTGVYVLKIIGQNNSTSKSFIKIN